MKFAVATQDPLLLLPHRHTQRPQRVQNSDRFAVLCQNLWQPLITVRALIDARAAQFNLLARYPFAHHLWCHLARSLYFASLAVRFALGFHPSHDAASTMDR